MKERDKKFIENWKKTRDAGFKKYALTQGLGFGILITIINLLFIHFTSEKEMGTEKFFISALIMILIGGLTYAVVSWLINDYLYNKKTKN